MEADASADGVPMVLTEEGKRPRRMFEAYPTLNYYSMTNTTRMLIFTGALLALLLLRTLYLVWGHVGTTTSEPDAPLPWTPPAQTVTVVDLSEAVLNGLASGRTRAAVYDNEDRNRRLMQQINTPCATPWLEYAWRTGQPEPPAARDGATGANVLSITGVDKPLLNAHITWRSEATALVVAPFKYKSAKDTRTIATAVAVSHTKGVYNATDLQVAFCIQELY